MSNDKTMKISNTEIDQTITPSEQAPTLQGAMPMDSTPSTDMETVLRENALLKQQLEFAENSASLLRNQIESMEQMLSQPSNDQENLSTLKKDLEEEIASLRSERDSLSSQLTSLHQNLLVSSSSSALHQNNALLTAIVEDEANNTGSLNLLLNEKDAELYRLKNELAVAQTESEAFRRRAEEAEHLLEEEAKVVECLRKENRELMEDLSLLRKQSSHLDEPSENVVAIRKELEQTREEMEKQKLLIATLQRQLDEEEKRVPSEIDLASTKCEAKPVTIVPEDSGEKGPFVSLPQSAIGEPDVDSSLLETQQTARDPLEQSFTDASDVSGISLLQVHRETLQELDTMRSRAEEAESSLLRSRATIEELQQQLSTSQQETAEWRAQADQRSLELAAMAQEAQSQRLRAEDLEDIRRGFLETLSETNETPSNMTEWQSRVETAEKETAQWKNEVDEMTKKVAETEEQLQTSQSALAEARAEIAAVAQKVSESHREAEEAKNETNETKRQLDTITAELNRHQQALRRAEDRLVQISDELAASRKETENERELAASFKTQLEGMAPMVTLQTSSGPLSTGNPSALQAFLEGQANRLAALEGKLETSRREREEERTQLRDVQSMTRKQSQLVESQLTETRKQLATLKVTLANVEGQLKEREAEVEKLRGEGMAREESWREKKKGEMEEVREKLEEAERKMRKMKEQLEEAKTAIQKRDRFIETSKAANEKLRKNEGVYKEAIAELKRYAKEREKELNELYKEMKGLKVIQTM